MTDEFVEISIPLPVSVTVLSRLALAITSVAPSATMSQVGNAMTIKCSVEEINSLAYADEDEDEGPVCEICHEPTEDKDRNGTLICLDCQED